MGLSIGTLFPLRLRLWFGKLIFGSEFRDKVIRVSWHRVIKGPIIPCEIEAMQYIATHTSIPIPKIYKIHTPINGTIYIEMEWIQGQPLDRAWHRMNAAQRNTVTADIRRHVAELRALPPPVPDVVSSALGNPAHDGRIGSSIFGPMSLDAFQELARSRLCVEDIPLLGDDVVQVHTVRRYKTKFTHADLAPRNIIVSRDGTRVVAIIDWAYAGWYPEYWEYTRAHYVPFHDVSWKDCLDQALLPHYETELAAECVLWRRLPEPGSGRRRLMADGTSSTWPSSLPSAAWLSSRVGLPRDDLWTRWISWFWSGYESQLTLAA